VKNRTARTARYLASVAVDVAHMLLALWAASVAGGWAWRHGYTLPYDTSSSAALTAAIVFGLVAAGAVLVLPGRWVFQIRARIQGWQVEVCDGCGALISTSDDNDAHPTSKETVR
jgi:hypothetical protein